MEYIEYMVDNEIKQEYLQNKPTGTAESDMYVLRDFDNYEQKAGKQVYNLNISELNEMFATLRNSSKGTIRKNKSILINYISFCISKKIVPHMENRAKYIKIGDFIHRQALLNKFISKDKLKEYQGELANYQDKLLLELLYNGIRGRTVEEGTLEEIINLTIDDVDKENKRLILKQNDNEDRILDNVEESLFTLIRNTYNQEFYVENNGEPTKNKRTKGIPKQILINKAGEHGAYYHRHIFRIPGKDKFEKFHPSLFNSRIGRIKVWVKNRYLTVTALYESGMIQMAMDIFKENGEITDTDFKRICNRFNYGIKEINESPQEPTDSPYWYKVKEKFNEYKDLLL